MLNPRQWYGLASVVSMRTNRGTQAVFRSNVCCPYRRAARDRAACNRDDSRRAPSLHRDAGRSSRASLDSARSCDLAHTCPSQTRNCTSFRTMAHFYRAAWNATRSYDEISVRPSVRPSVCLSNACIVTKRKKAMFRFLYHMKEHLS